MGDPACFRVSSLAERWDCSPGKIRQMIAAGELTCRNSERRGAADG